MDIKKILTERGKDLYIEELDYFVTELKTGDYPPLYIEDCLGLIETIKNLKNSLKFPKKEVDNISESEEISPNNSNLIITNKPIITYSEDPVIKVKQEIEDIRKKGDYNSRFITYVKEKDCLNEKIIDALIKFLLPWELDILISHKNFSEEILDKYFNSFDPSSISKYQYFSEEFFIKHFDQLPYLIVLQKGVNEWRKKSNRSSKLDVFLRLKGVTI